jgi:hypothetical protein
MLFNRFADNTDVRSVATRLRRQRFQILLDMIESISGVVTILDVGGRMAYWEMMLAEIAALEQVSVTLLDVVAQVTTRPNFTAVIGDGRAMPQYHDQQFDIVFSNSVIEHVGSFADQKRMALEIRRVGAHYYVQTPNRHFPIEPHFVFPGFQYLPLSWRIWLVRHFSLGWYPKFLDDETARALVTSIRLLNRREFVQLFPQSKIYEEKYAGLIKSFVAYTGYSPAPYF